MDDEICKVMSHLPIYKIQYISQKSIFLYLIMLIWNHVELLVYLQPVYLSIFSDEVDINSINIFTLEF